MVKEDPVDEIKESFAVVDRLKIDPGHASLLSSNSDSTSVAKMGDLPLAEAPSIDLDTPSEETFWNLPI